MSTDAEWEAGLARLDARLDTISERLAELTADVEVLTDVTKNDRLRVTEVLVEERMLRDRTENTRRNLTERLDLLDAGLGVTIERIVGHTADPDAHDPGGA